MPSLGISTHNQWNCFTVSTIYSLPRLPWGKYPCLTEDPTNSGSNNQDCQTPLFSQLSPNLPTSQCHFPRERAEAAAKSQNPTLLPWPRAALTTQDTHFSTSCLWAARRDTGHGESQSVNMNGNRTNESDILAGAKNVPWGFICVSKWLRMDKKTYRSFYISHFPEMNVMTK